jgi:hypothetical protein
MEPDIQPPQQDQEGSNPRPAASPRDGRHPSTAAARLASEAAARYRAEKAAAPANAPATPPGLPILQAAASAKEIDQLRAMRWFEAWEENYLDDGLAAHLGDDGPAPLPDRDDPVWSSDDWEEELAERSMSWHQEQAERRAAQGGEAGADEAPSGEAGHAADE